LVIKKKVPYTSKGRSAVVFQGSNGPKKSVSHTRCISGTFLLLSFDPPRSISWTNFLQITM